MGRKSKVVEMLIERRMLDADMTTRSQPIKDRLDKVGMLLNAMKAKWNTVNAAPANQIQEKDYNPKEFDR
jgi:hypothetical protein